MNLREISELVKGAMAMVSPILQDGKLRPQLKQVESWERRGLLKGLSPGGLPTLRKARRPRQYLPHQVPGGTGRPRPHLTK